MGSGEARKGWRSEPRGSDAGLVPGHRGQPRSFSPWPAAAAPRGVDWRAMVSSGLLLTLSLLAMPQASSRSSVRTGLEVLATSGFRELHGKRVGAVVNHTSRDDRGRHLADLLAAVPQVQLVRLFAPEHGVRGDVDQHVADGVDPGTGRPVVSLYSAKSRRPDREQLADLDVLLFDLQDVGARFYTYTSTLSAVLDVAAAAGCEVWVLDRPCPIGGDVVEGPMLEPGRESFVGAHPIPARHGMTPGELARLFVGEQWVGQGKTRLRVIAAEGWRRGQLWSELGRPWVRPSPNMASLETALVYPALCLLEGSTVSEGRGTDAPFLQLGAPWIDAKALAARLSAATLPGLVVAATEFTPRAMPGRADHPKHQDQPCRGVRLTVTDPHAVRTAPLLVQVFLALLAQPDRPADLLRAERFDRLAGCAWLREQLLAGAAADAIQRRMAQEVERFLPLRARYLLYR